MRVPETLAEAKRLVRESEKTEMQPLAEGYWGKEVALTYGKIPQRWLMVFSQAAYDRELHTLTKNQEKECHAAEKQRHKLGLQTFNCQEDAETAAKQFNQGWKFHLAVAEAAPITQYARRGRPSAEDEPEVVGYSLNGSISSDPERGETAKRTLGKFIIATNELDPQKSSSNKCWRTIPTRAFQSSVVFVFSKIHFSSLTVCFSRNPSGSWR